MRKSIKKLTLLMTIAVLSFTFTGCQNESPSTDESKQAETTV